MFGEGRKRWLRMKADQQNREAIRDRQTALADATRKEAFEKEWSDLQKQIERGPAMQGTMLGTASDPLSAKAIMARSSRSEGDKDEEDELPPTPMALPESPRRGKR